MRRERERGAREREGGVRCEWRLNKRPCQKSKRAVHHPWREKEKKRTEQVSSHRAILTHSGIGCVYLFVCVSNFAVKSTPCYTGIPSWQHASVELLVAEEWQHTSGAMNPPSSPSLFSFHLSRIHARVHFWGHAYKLHGYVCYHLARYYHHMSQITYYLLFSDAHLHAQFFLTSVPSNTAFLPRLGHAQARPRPQCRLTKVWGAVPRSVSFCK